MGEAKRPYGNLDQVNYKCNSDAASDQNCMYGVPQCEGEVEKSRNIKTCPNYHPKYDCNAHNTMTRLKNQLPICYQKYKAALAPQVAILEKEVVIILCSIKKQ